MAKETPEHTIEKTRTSSAWVAAGVGLFLLLVAIIFMAQNPEDVEVRFLAWEGTIALGLAMLSAAVLGGLIVLLLGLARMLQLRRVARRHRRADEDRSAAKRDRQPEPGPEPAQQRGPQQG